MLLHYFPLNHPGISRFLNVCKFSYEIKLFNCDEHRWGGGQFFLASSCSHGETIINFLKSFVKSTLFVTRNPFFKQLTTVVHKPSRPAHAPFEELEYGDKKRSSSGGDGEVLLLPCDLLLLSVQVVERSHAAISYSQLSFPPFPVVQLLFFPFMVIFYGKATCLRMSLQKLQWGEPTPETRGDHYRPTRLFHTHLVTFYVAFPLYNNQR